MCKVSHYIIKFIAVALQAERRCYYRLVAVPGMYQMLEQLTQVHVERYLLPFAFRSSRQLLLRKLKK
jgi:hypothetical protein